MKIKTFIGGFDKNFSYLIWCEKTRIAAIIDPATEPTPIQEYIDNLYVLITELYIKNNKVIDNSFLKIIEHIKEFTELDIKTYLGLNNKIIFKCEDILDYLHLED